VSLSDRGYRGHHALRRARGDEVEFVTMTWFDSLDSLRGFAGEDHETPISVGVTARKPGDLEASPESEDHAARTRRGPDARRSSHYPLAGG
jgi:heme-degrading monooxygenase HmoA